MSNWTPGPWTMRDMTDIASLDGITQTFWIGPASDQWASIAVVRAGSDDDDLPAQTEANARLIVAAPEMAEMLRRVADIYGEPPTPFHWTAKLHALLARIKGDAP